MEIPHTKAWRILITARIVSLGLHASVQIDIETVFSPRVMIIGSNRSSMTHATFQHGPLISATCSGIGINIVGGEVQVSEHIGRDIDVYTLHIAFVAILVERIAYHLVSLILSHLRELSHQHLSGGIINIDILLDYHIVDTIQIARHTDCNSLCAIFGIQREVIALLRFQVLIAKTDLCLSTIH